MRYECTPGAYFPRKWFLVLRPLIFIFAKHLFYVLWRFFRPTSGMKSSSVKYIVGNKYPSLRQKKTRNFLPIDSPLPRHIILNFSSILVSKYQETIFKLIERVEQVWRKTNKNKNGFHCRRLEIVVNDQSETTIRYISESVQSNIHGKVADGCNNRYGV